MKFKNIIALSIFAVFVISAIKLYQTPYSPCDTPVTFKIGSIDSKFGLKQDAVKKDTVEASEILNKASGKILLLYSDEGKVTINFVYDARTALDENIKNQQNIIDLQNLSLKDRVKQYESDVSAFEKQLADYNQKVQKYNNEGGAPPDIYQQLNNERDQLKTEGDALNDRAKKLNLETNNYNLKVDSLNKNVTDFNQALNQKPEEGLFDGATNTINIYFVDNRPELIHTLAHEFGHAIGMMHVNDPKAIMYPLTSTSLEMTADDISEVNTVCESYPLPVHWINSLLIRYEQNTVLKI